MIVVSSLTVAQRERLIPLSALASSPHAVAEARLWSLVTSALLVSSPLFWSLLSFALFGALTLRFCGSRVLLVSAFAGHIASTLVVYALLALARTFDPRAFETLLKAPDYGVSAVSAAWLGAMATVSWGARNRTLRGKIATALAVVGVALFGLILRRHVGFLDLEHVVAFAIGVAVAVGLSTAPNTKRVELGAVPS
jgi:Rhomboid family